MFNRKSAALASGMFAALALAATLLTGGPAAAAASLTGGPAAAASLTGSPADPASVKIDPAALKPTKAAVRADFAAQGRAAGLNTTQAAYLQGKVNAYLSKIGGTQKDFDTIALKGADLHVTVPGELHPRGLDGTYCAYKYFCAYEGEWQMYDEIHMYSCEVRIIPWFTTGSWVNNQTRGTRPLLTFLSPPNGPGGTWSMPGAYAEQLSGVGWSPVYTIDPC